MDNSRTNWIWTPDWHAEDKDVPRLVLFRYVIDLYCRPGSARIKISADTRYKLYINGTMAEIGPSRGDGQIWYYDEPDILPFLKKGKNVIAVQVLRYPTEHRKGNHGMYRTEYPGLYISGTITDIGWNTYILDPASEGINGIHSNWKCRKDNGFRIISEAEDFAPLQIYEEYKAEDELLGWMEAEYDDSSWDEAWNYPFMSEAISPGNLHPRTIPYLYRKKGSFKRVILRKSSADESAWMGLTEGKALTIPRNTEEIVEYDAGEEMTAYLLLKCSGGKGACITLLQAESYYIDDENGTPVKKRRDDYEHGYLIGHSDIFYPAGCTDSGSCPDLKPEAVTDQSASESTKRKEQYEPFWFRTFRFIRMTIRTGDEPLTLGSVSFTETGYPLTDIQRPEASDPRFEKIWDISERTLRRCMHETYEDCPFYEQLQYIMDSRSEILYTYATTGDDRLARKCMDDFKRSQRYDGMLNCSYPNYGPNIIPGFPVYYILMLYDHMRYFKDRELLIDHLPVMERILRFFHVRLDEKGYVTRLGGLNGKAPKWSFIDWTEQWKETTGVPTAVLKGPVTMESLLYIMGLQHAALIADFLDHSELASYWLEEAEKVQSAVNQYCTGAGGLIQDGPGVEEYSQHVQVFAILTDTVSMERGKKNLMETLLYPEKYAQCSVAMMYYLFRALQKTNLYDWTRNYWNIWDNMIKKNATTCVEDDVQERSDCHAWGALILYELPSVILGVRPASHGYQTIMIAPEPGYLTHAQGSVYTPYGPVKVRWTLDNGGEVFYELPEGVTAIVDTAALKKAARLKR